MTSNPEALSRMSLDERLEAIGNNTGNLSFRFAMERHIAEPVLTVGWQDNPQEVRDRCRVLVVPEASAVNPARDYGARAEFIQRVDRPVVVAGLGAQARSIGDHVPLSLGTLDYLRSLAVRTNRIGVRGQYSAEVLAFHGIGNTTVVGCPTNFLSDIPNLGSQIESRLKAGIFDQCALTLGDQKSALRAPERKLLRWMRERNGTLILQSGASLKWATSGGFTLSRRERWRVRSHLGLWLPRTWGRDVDFARLVGLEAQTFFDVPKWMELLKSMDLALGTRIHGNLLAIQSGTPAVCIHHDSRTEELCRTTLIPSMSIKELMHEPSMESLTERVAAEGFSGASYDSNRRLLAAVYSSLFHDAGIEISDGLSEISSGSTSG